MFCSQTRVEQNFDNYVINGFLRTFTSGVKVHQIMQHPIKGLSIVCVFFPLLKTLTEFSVIFCLTSCSSRSALCNLSGFLQKSLRIICRAKWRNYFRDAFKTDVQKVESQTLS